jgi:hypothetical protein
MLCRAEWTAAVLLTLALAGLHLLRVSHAGGLWRDEAAAAALATLPAWSEVAESFQHEAFPLLFPAAVRGWVGAFGGGDLALRLFGALVGLALLGALWCNVRSWFPGRAGSGLPLLSLILVGTNPAVLVFGDSLRGYGLGTVLILLTFGAFGRLIVRPDRRSVVLAALLAIASVQALLHNAVLLLALGLAATLAAARRQRWGSVAAVLGCGALAALSLLPYAGPLAAARSWNVLVTFPIAPADLLQALARTLAGPLPAFLGLWLLLLALGLAVGIWSLSRPSAATSTEATSGQDGNTAADLTLYLILSLPLALLTQLGFLWQLGYAPRPWYFLPLLALAGSALDLLLAPNRTGPPSSRTQTLRAARLAGALLAALAVALPLWQVAHLRMTDLDLAAAVIAERARPGDLILVNPWDHGVGYRRYHRSPALWETVPPLGDHRFHRYDLIKQRMQEADPLVSLRADLAATLRRGNAVWLLGEIDIPPPGMPPPVLPPAPHPETGWLDVPYRTAWSRQLGAYLRDHALGGEQIALPASGPVSGYEDVQLLVVRGWRGP